MSTIQLSRWRIIEFSTGERIVAGVNVQSRKPSCSANIVAFDPIALRATSATGTIYELVGDAGSAADFDVEIGLQSYLWDYGIDPETVRDVSAPRSVGGGSSQQ